MRDAVEAGTIEVPYVNTCDNLADFFTKSQPPAMFFTMRDIIMNVPRGSSLVCSSRVVEHGGVL